MLPRLATYQSRALPSYLILGTQRGGTTALHVSLAHHPQVLPPTRKEIQYFDRFYSLGSGWYRAHFPRHTDLAYLPGRGITGEATANYLYDPRAPFRVQMTVPSAKLIVLIRNPIDRAFSAWKLLSRQGREQRSFSHAIAAELESAPDLEPATFRRRPSPSYLARGRYEEQLLRWYTHCDRHNLLVIPSEQLFTHPEPIFDKITGFLDLVVWQPEAFRPVYSTESRDLDSRMRLQLARYFAPHNERLQALVGEDLGWE